MTSDKFRDETPDSIVYIVGFFVPLAQATKPDAINIISEKSTKFVYPICQMTKLETYISALIKLCETHKVRSLYAFGSVLTDRFNQESDIDMIVDFINMEVEDYADNYFDFKFSLQDILNRSVDQNITHCDKFPPSPPTGSSQPFQPFNYLTRKMVLESPHVLNLFDHESQNFDRYRGWWRKL